MKLPSLVLLTSLAVFAGGCSKKAKYEKLCARIEEKACSEKMLGFSTADRMTLVVSELSEESGAYQELFDSVLKVPPPDRKKAVATAVGDALGKEWSCPAFDALWDADEDYCLEAMKKN